jgi:hypothetical protein
VVQAQAAISMAADEHHAPWVNAQLDGFACTSTTVSKHQLIDNVCHLQQLPNN